MLIALLATSAIAGFGLLQGVTYWHQGNIPKAVLAVGGALFIVSAVTAFGTINAVEHYMTRVLNGEIQVEQAQPRAEIPPYRR